jgi:hypothetical protein
MQRNKTIFGIFMSLFLINKLFAQQVSIIETQYQDRPHFKITTTAATYYFDKAGGGFSSMIDKDGLDWISYNKDSSVATYPKSSAGQFRGLPNAVFGNEDGGCGHPGFDKAVSEKIADNIIETKSKSGKWGWTWTFYKDYAVWNVTKVDSTYAYWLLYEGTIAGSWNNLADKYWGSSKTPLGAVNDFYKNQSILDYYNWIFFGDKKVNRILYIIQQQPDEYEDLVGFLGSNVEGMNASTNGMVVAGFGRNKNGKATMNKLNTFRIGFYEKAIITKKDYKRLTKKISKMTF